MKSLTASQRACLEAMGIDVWVTRDAETPDDPSGEEAVRKHTSAVALESAESMISAEAAGEIKPALPLATDWEGLRQAVTACTQCELHQTRSQTVFGTGDQNADWLIIGEAPGAEEDRQGEPFVGRAGKLLTAMLTAIGFERSQVYIANILKCRPPNNRDPKQEEAEACNGFLQQQIALLQPKIILAVGRIAAQRLLNSRTSLARMRQKVHYLRNDVLERDIPVVVTYHPAYLLRSPSEKQKSWQDLLFARQVVKQNSP